MKRWTSPWFTARVVLACGLLPGSLAVLASGQESGSAKLGVLLGRARTSEQRGHLEQAAQDWVQVLLVDPNDAEALAGLVRAARAGGKTAEADYYLSRLRIAHPNGPELARLAGQTGGDEARDPTAELAEAAKLSRAGDARGAMVLYRRVYGVKPPAGPQGLAYYEAEAGTEDGRAHAIAGLRALADLYPSEPRYTVALGRVLLGNPRTRAEGRTLLERYPGEPEAVSALRGEGGAAGGVAVAAARPGAGGALNGTAHAGAETKTVQRVTEAAPVGDRQARQVAKVEVAHRAPARVASGRHQAFAAEERAAFAALDAHRPGEADDLFRAILAKDPTDPRALAGAGYLRLLSDDFKGALNYFMQAQENGDRSLALTRALINTQFELALQGANAARAGGDLARAEGQYRAALRERPADPEALEGLGTTLLQAERMEQAIPVYTKLTEVRPLSPSAWRGLVIATSRAGRSGGALAAEAHEPGPVREPLSHDPIYLEALSKAKEAQSGTPLAQAKRAQDAREAEAAARRPPRPPVPTAPVQPSGEEVAAERTEQGRLALGRGENARAATLFREALARGPSRADAWRGLVLALYADGHEAEAATAADTVPGPVRAQLEGDATFQVATGAVYLKASRPSEALHAFARAQNVFVAQKLPPPANLLVQIAALLAARNDEANLYRELLYVGTRPDLNDAQRRDVQRIWANWAVRRARSLAVAGDQPRAVVLLNAAAQAFPGNAEVVSAVADGYAGVGLPREATALYKAQDLSRSSAAEQERAIRAALAAHDLKAAEGWLRLGRDRFPSEPMLLTLAAELEQDRGHEARAVELSAQARALSPAQDPKLVLTAALREARAGHGWSREEAGQLATLLAPAEALGLATGTDGGRPFLPTGADGPARNNPGAQTPVLAGYDEPSR